MGDDDHCAGKIHKRVFKYFFGVDIEMVRRLVHYQHVRSGKHELHQRKPCLLSPAQIADLKEYRIIRKEEPPQYGSHFCIRIEPEGIRQFFKKCVAACHSFLGLVVISRFYIVAFFQIAAVRLYLFHQYPEEGRLAYAVGADDTYPFAPLDIKIHMLEKLFPVGAVAETF